MGRHYLWGFARTEAEKTRCLGEKVDGWQNLMATLDGVARRHPQAAYAGLLKSLQQEWAFVQHINLGIGMEFQAVEDELRDTFLLYLFQGATSHIPGREINSLPVKQAGTALPNPNQTK